MRSADYQPGIAGSSMALPMFAEHDATPSRTISTTRYLAFAVLILAVSFAFRAWNLDGADMWTDEVLTALRAQAPLGDALDSILGAGNQAPVYYLLMQLLPHGTDVLLRAPSVIMGVLNVALLIALISHLYGERSLGLQAGALLAVNPLHIILSRTARFYTLLFMLCLVITILFLLMVRGRRSPGLWGAFWLCSTVAYLTHYSALALPAAQGVLLVLMWRRYRDLIVPWGAVQIAAVLPPLIWILLASQEYEPVGYVGMSHYPTVIDLPITVLNLLVGFDGTWQIVAIPGVIVAAIGVVAGLVYLLRGARRQPESLYWAAQAVLPVVLLFVMSHLVYGKYKDRYFALLMPAVMLVFLWGWRRLAPRLAPYALAAALFSGAMLTVHIFDTGSYQRTDWRDAGHYLAEHFEPGDQVMFARWTTYEAFKHSYDGDPGLLDASFLLTETPDTTVVERDAGRVWVVYRDQWEDFHFQGWMRDFDPLRPGLSDMSEWLIARQSRIASTEYFDGVVIYEIVRSG